MNKDYRNMISTAPPNEAGSFSPGQLMRDFMSRVGLSDLEVSEEISSTSYGGRSISSELVASWSNISKPVSRQCRRPLRDFIRHICHHKVATLWDEEFVNCWARFEAANGNARRIFIEHHRWIKRRFAANVVGENFPLRDIYVPIHILPKGVREGTNPEIVAYGETFLRDFAVKQSDHSVDWVFVTGGPGSGKSALALNIAQLLAGERKGFTLFFRGTRFDGQSYIPDEDLPDVVDDRISIKHYFEQFRRTSEDRMTLIIDGLDEIGTQSYAEPRVLEVIKSVRAEISLAKSFGKSVRVIVFGRDTVTRMVADKLASLCLLFEMGDLSGELVDARGERVIYGEELRGIWWRKYLKAKGLEPDEKLPRYLDDPTESLFDLSKEPLLSFLIARSAWPAPPYDVKSVVDQIDRHTSQKNRNQIYSDIIEKVRKGEDWGDLKSELLPSADFTDILQHMAVATWQNGTLRAVSIKEIQDVIKNGDPSLIRKFEKLQQNLGDDGDPTLITSFYYRFQDRPMSQGLIGNPRDYEIEFTHKTFSEYLLTTFLFDEFEALMLAHGTGSSEVAQASAQRRWMAYVMSGPQQREIGLFARDEAVLRLEKYDWSIWNRAKSVSTLMKSLIQLEDAPHGTWFSKVSSSERLQRSLAALMLFWGALNQARYAQSHVRLKIEKTTFDGPDFHLSTPSFTLNKAGSAVTGDPFPDTFSVSALSGITWEDGDTPGYYASGGEITGSHFARCAIEGSVWSSVFFVQVRFLSCNISRSRFVLSPMEDCRLEDTTATHSVFKDALILETELENVDFEQSTFSGIRFMKCDFTDVQFDRCSFHNCEFVDCTFDECSFDQANFSLVIMRQCRFSECSFGKADFEGETIEGCHGLTIG